MLSAPCQLHPIPLHHLRLQFKRENDPILVSVDQKWLQLERDGRAIIGHRQHDFRGELNFRVDGNRILPQKNKRLDFCGLQSNAFYFSHRIFTFRNSRLFLQLHVCILNPRHQYWSFERFVGLSYFVPNG